MRPIGSRWRSAKFQILISNFLHHFLILCRCYGDFFRRPAAFVFHHSAEELMFGKFKNTVASTNRPSRIWCPGFLSATLCFCGRNKNILHHSARYGGRLVFFCRPTEGRDWDRFRAYSRLQTGGYRIWYRFWYRFPITPDTR